MSVGLRRNAQVWGNPVDSVAGTLSNLNAAATWVAFGFTLDRDRTLNALRAFVNKTASPVAADISCELYDTSSAGNPNTSQGTFGTADGTTGWVNWAGLSVALTANTLYWLVFKNLNGTPTTNFYSISFLDSVLPTVSGQDGEYGWPNKRSTNSGGAWSTLSSGPTLGLRLQFADGFFDGLPIVSTTASTTAPQVFGTREAGVKFVSPAVDLAVRGISLKVQRSGTPTGQLRYRIYVGDTLLATTGLLPTSAAAGMNVAGAAYVWYPLYFSSVITIPANSTIRVVASETTQSDTSSNRFQVFGHFIDNDADSKALCGNYVSTLSTDGGATFADDDTMMHAFALLLNSEVTAGIGGEPGLSAPRRGLNLYRYRRGHLL